MEVALEKKLELINKIGFFSRFDEQDKLTMANMADFRQFLPGESLIQKDSINTYLLFIINGNVDIMIDNKLVVSLSGGGHVFGELSFVHESPASATVVASAKSVVMMFDTNVINSMIDSVYYKLRMNVYRSCAEILAKRLIHTNSMATTTIRE